MSKKETEIIVDCRENSKIKKSLSRLGCKVIEKTITPADYVLSSECAVERKRTHDFLNSIYDGRLFEQVERLATVYKKSIMLVEGKIDLENVPNPSVFWGALAKIIANHNISIIFTSDLNDTAMFLSKLSQKIQEEKRKQLIAKHKPKIYTISQRQLLTIQNLPNIGPTRAEKLLKKFGSVKKIVNATDKEFLAIEGIGKKTVQEIRKLLDTKYPGLEDIF
jgi:ERCC4-type nuclease